MVSPATTRSWLPKSLTARLLLGLLTIHAALLPLLFVGLLYIVKQGYQTQFVEQVRSSAYLLANNLSHVSSNSAVAEQLEEALLSGRILHAQVVLTNGKIIAPDISQKQTHIFHEDFAFGEGGDSVYFIAAPLINANNDIQGILQLGYDEMPTRDQIAFANQRGLVLASIYILLSFALVAFLSPKLARMQKKLVYQAQHDSLTGLPNRNHMQSIIERETKLARRHAKSFALILLDLDNFKEVNDTLGHDTGDSILIETASRLQECAPGSGIVARLGGDEFSLLVRGDAAVHTLKIADNLSRALQKPFTEGEQSLHIRPSVGIALFPDHGTDFTTLLRRADIAMYEAKRKRSDYVIYDSNIDKHSLRKLTMSTELREALEHNELVIHFQPKLNLISNTITSAEVLVRWQHPRMGLIPPDEFVPLAEQVGLIDSLTMYVLRLALQQSQIWNAAGTPIKLAVNLSAWNLQNDDLPDQINTLLTEFDLSASSLELEITESAIFSDLAHASEILEHIHAAGIQLAIDDFGTGYSSLSHLKKLPASYIKIDKSFVMDMDNDENDSAIVHASIDLAKNLGLSVIAEGVEHEQTLIRLKTIGCDVAQGFFISRPLPADDFEKRFLLK
ncbi:MAG TPA: EAL domain-containing protein [Candidatus Tenderia electrophaga]|uniref:cyclic-guanylate-specific phosphodiesterase n=1 Tax=Candidatus Tenderia electrophaga TaxID=1748243 RepID=A0A832N5L0_9GAMM|nr:EAL domain-containing protein [Candidatus Tenderia electrophaga]